jgi:hypothetical protein
MNRRALLPLLRVRSDPLRRVRSALVAVAALGSLSVAAQPPLDVPPPLPQQRPPEASLTPEASRHVIRLPAGVRDQDDGAAPPAELTEVPADRQLPPARVTRPVTQIDQRRRGNRVTEIVVTPAGSTRSYVIVNREGERPLWTEELSAGLSTPRLLRLDF